MDEFDDDVHEIRHLTPACGSLQHCLSVRLLLFEFEGVALVISEFYAFARSDSTRLLLPAQATIPKTPNKRSSVGWTTLVGRNTQPVWALAAVETVRERNIVSRLGSRRSHMTKLYRWIQENIQNSVKRMKISNSNQNLSQLLLF